MAARQQRQQLNNGGGGGSLGGHQLRLGHEHDHPTRFLSSPSAFHLTVPNEVRAFNRQLGFFFAGSRLTPTWHGIFELARRGRMPSHRTANGLVIMLFVSSVAFRLHNTRTQKRKLDVITRIYSREERYIGTHY